MDPETILPLKQTLSGLPPEVQSTDLFSTIAERQTSSTLPILVVLDDDPTGTQTCHGINVLTVWNHDILLEEFKATTTGFFILTNSRALHTPEARKLIAEICNAVRKAADAADRQFEVVLRGDSTLRGHFPDEPEVAEEQLGSVDGWVLAPFFRQGGRLTINDVHYVADASKDELVPAAKTPFARDASFGYQNSDLKKYVVEKSRGGIGEDRIQSISLDDIRNGGTEMVTKKLFAFTKGSVIIVNAVVDTDMEVFVRGLLEAEAKGKRYLYRTGAAFVSTRLGIPQIPPLTPTDLEMDTSSSAPGGLIIAGSHVPKTTQQLESLISSRSPNKLTVITLDVQTLLAQDASQSDTNVNKTVDDSSSSSSSRSDNPLSIAITQTNKTLEAGGDVLLMTSRDLITGSSESTSLRIAAVVASSLVTYLQALRVRPRYVIAKGGITSSDAATRGLGMKRARVVGQASSGVPLWMCDESTSKWTGIPFVVFPGNVGGVESLRDLVAGWAKRDG